MDTQPQPRVPDSGHYVVASDGGAEHWAVVASLIESCKLNAIDPQAYGHVTVHGFRSTFKDWVRDRTRFENYVSEAALAHASGDKIEAAYARSAVFDKRRKLMEAWAKFFASGVTAEAANKVVALRSA